MMRMNRILKLFSIIFDTDNILSIPPTESVPQETMVSTPKRYVHKKDRYINPDESRFKTRKKI